MKFIGKVISIFGVQKIKEAQGAEVWTVSWRTTVPYGFGCDFGQTVFKAFLLEQDAKNFAQGLRDAHNLLQNTSYINIQITKQK